MALTHPPALSPGDRIAVVAPSLSIDDERLAVGLGRLRNVFDLEPVVFDTARRDREWLRDHPEERAADVMKAFEDPGIRGIVATTGGDDQLRVLKHVDADVLGENPTRFYGYSDNDNLRLLLWNRGIVSYGVQVMPSLALDPEIHPYTERHLRRALFESRLGEIEPSAEWSDDWYDFDTREPREWHENDGWTWWRGVDGADGTDRTDGREETDGAGSVDGATGTDTGDAESVAGRVWGGCYAIVNWHLQTSRYLPDPAALDGAVLALETSEELPRAADVGHTLRSMGERGLLERFAGMLVGRPKAHSPPADREVAFEAYRERLREAVLAQLREYNRNATAVFGVDFGHTDPHVPLPVGGTVHLDSTEERIEFT
ncbi:LD-carboxypeptidase [Halobacteriales archaeon QS_4_69_34]|nr:MAG: LD-carboxypeptidase [Halobacteriales archaeon QS_4_69_34]